MKYYEIDLAGLKDQNDLHDRLVAEMEITSSQNNNLDSFRNVLEALEKPCTITVWGYAPEDNDSLQEYLRSMKAICDEAVKEMPGLTFEWEKKTDRPEVDTSGKRLPKVRPKSINPQKSPFYKMCYVCGPDNPVGLHLPLRFIDGKGTTEITPTENMQGLMAKKGSLMHGGFTNMIFDEVMTYVMMGRGIETVTLTMTVNFISPARTGHLMEAEAWLERREGRKLWAAAKLVDKETGATVATATGLYYQVDLAAFIDGIE